MAEKIYTARDKAKDEGQAGTQERMRRFGWKGQTMSAQSVNAQIDFGAWIAVCEKCGGAEYADPDFAFFFCEGCKNQYVGGAAIAVVFPAERAEIEKAVLERKILRRGGVGEVAQTRQAFPAVLGASRSWIAGETPELLREQHTALIAKQKGDT